MSDDKASPEATIVSGVTKIKIGITEENGSHKKPEDEEKKNSEADVDNQAGVEAVAKPVGVVIPDLNLDDSDEESDIFEESYSDTDDKIIEQWEEDQLQDSEFEDDFNEFLSNIISDD